MRTKITILLTLMVLNANAQLKPVTYNDGNQKLNGFAAKPIKALKQKPGILILPTWLGINNHCKEVAEKLSKLGYHAFIADIYGEGNYPNTPQEAGKIAGFYKNDYKAYQRRIALALEQLIQSGADADNIVVIGYCFGGTGALEAARAGMNVKGIVTFHGDLGKDASRKNDAIKPKVLVLHGADDPHVPQKDIEAFQKEMNEGNADWQMIYYSNAVHAFTEKEAGNDNSKGAAYNEKADKRSWEHFMLFLDELFVRK
ncbi:dienelactone hydrolase family protein [Flavobacterium sp. NRK1]|uniref:dienelactone hydrolase family protein n=1 Tax=Flavobacterium sp. NRK1 TaxID=2954929 RepID=UPI0020932120|nr:dienelactone hydrolase family protein [Flavobacterium sp. NRK1]MCO6148704.1 dienelactone hydrolase family protein [Flavobacterium sp. NRK1]